MVPVATACRISASIFNPGYATGWSAFTGLTPAVIGPEPGVFAFYSQKHGLQGYQRLTPTVVKPFGPDLMLTFKIIV